MERVAKCACGQLKVTLQGDPLSTGMCTCTYCQKRTGSAFGLSSYFDKESEFQNTYKKHINNNCLWNLVQFPQTWKSDLNQTPNPGAEGPIPSRFTIF